MNKKGSVFIIIIFIISILFGCRYSVGTPEKLDDINMEIMNMQEYKIAVQYYNAQNYDDAIRYYQKILDWLNREPKAEYSASYWIKGMIGSCYVQKGEYGKAGAYIQEAREGLEKVGDSYEVSRIYQEEALYYECIAQYDRALECYEKALNYAEDGEIVQTYLGMAKSYALLEKEQEAINCYDLAITEGEKQHNRKGLVNVYYSKGVYLSQKNELEAAKQCVEKGLDYAEITWGANDIKVAEGYRKLSKIYVRESDYEAAYAYCRKAMDIFSNQSEAYSYDRDIASLYSNMGFLNMKLAEYSTALEMFKKSYDIVSGRMGDNEFSEFYENVLGVNIRSLYDNLEDNGGEYEAWFKENFEER